MKKRAFSDIEIRTRLSLNRLPCVKGAGTRGVTEGLSKIRAADNSIYLRDFFIACLGKISGLSLSMAFALSRVRTQLHAESEQIRASGWCGWGVRAEQPKVLSDFFKKSARSRARSPCRTPQRAKVLYGVSFYLRLRFQRKSGRGFFAVSDGEGQTHGATVGRGLLPPQERA